MKLTDTIFMGNLVKKQTVSFVICLKYRKSGEVSKIFEAANFCQTIMPKSEPQGVGVSLLATKAPFDVPLQLLQEKNDS
jgi:hypothetical protein